MTPVAALLTAYRPQFAHANYALVRQWLAEGADLELDILPVLKTWIAKKPDIYSLGFFTPYVRASVADRRKPAGPISIHERAKRIAFVTRTLGQCYPSDIAWLKRYEEEYGAVCGAETTGGNNRHGSKGNA